MTHRIGRIPLGVATLALLAFACSKKDEPAPQLAESTAPPPAASPSATDAAPETPKDDWSWADSATPASGSDAPAPGRVREPEAAPGTSIELPPEPPARERPRAAPKPRPVSKPPAPVANAPEPEPAPRPVPVKVTYSAPAGTSVGFSLDQALSSASSQVGETFTGTLSADVTDGAGHVVLPAGTRVRGSVTQAVPAKKADKKSFLTYSLVEAQLPDGTLVAISATQRLEGKGWTKKDGAIIGGSAGGGAVAGGIIGGDAKGAAIGAVLGAAIGSGVSLAKKGEDVTVPAGTPLTLPLEATVSVERTEMVMPVATSG